MSVELDLNARGSRRKVDRSLCGSYKKSVEAGGSELKYVWKLAGVGGGR